MRFLKQQQICNVISIFLLGICVTSSLVGCGAKAESEEFTSLGFPQTYIDCLSASALELITQNDDLEFYDAVVTIYYTQGNSETFAITSEGLSDALDSASLVIALGTAHNIKNDDILVIYSYQWLQPPEERWADAIGVTWDSTYLEMEDNSFAKVDEYTSDGKLTTTSEEVTYATGAPSGVVWFAALPSDDADTLSGYGSFTLLPKQSDFIVTFCTCYTHALSSETLSMKITPDGLTPYGNANFFTVNCELEYVYN